MPRESILNLKAGEVRVGELPAEIRKLLLEATSISPKIINKMTMSSVVFHYSKGWQGDYDLIDFHKLWESIVSMKVKDLYDMLDIWRKDGKETIPLAKFLRIRSKLQ